MSVRLWSIFLMPSLGLAFLDGTFWSRHGPSALALRNTDRGIDAFLEEKDVERSSVLEVPKFVAWVDWDRIVADPDVSERLLENDQSNRVQSDGDNGHLSLILRLAYWKYPIYVVFVD